MRRFIRRYELAESVGEMCGEIGHIFAEVIIASDGKNSISVPLRYMRGYKLVAVLEFLGRMSEVVDTKRQE